MKIYRKIYEQHYGPIPKDYNGRTYEIHHKDGNRKNNGIDNLQCVSIQEHYDIHYSQGDWAACLAIMKRIKISPEENSKILSELNKKRVENKTHNFLGGEIQKKKVKNGTHHLLGKNNPNHPSNKRIAKGIFHLQGIQGSEQNRKTALKRVKLGTHPFLGKNSPSQYKWTCENCGKSAKGKGNYTIHKNKCKGNIICQL